MTGAASLVRAQRDAVIANGELPHSASSPGSARRSTGDLAALGKRIFHDTPNEAKPYVGPRLACSSCHLNDRTTPSAAPMTGIPPLFPEPSHLAQPLISLTDRTDP